MNLIIKFRLLVIYILYAAHFSYNCEIVNAAARYSGRSSFTRYSYSYTPSYYTRYVYVYSPTYYYGGSTVVVAGGGSAVGSIIGIIVFCVIICFVFALIVALSHN